MRTASRVRSTARPPSNPPAPAESSQAHHSAPATGGVRRCTVQSKNSNALRAYFMAIGREIGGFAFRAMMHRLFADLEPSATVTEQNLADRVWYILRSNIFDVAVLERLRPEAAFHRMKMLRLKMRCHNLQSTWTNVDAAVNIPVVLDSNDDGTVA
ncbi:unnamed protein product [Parnassius apollo]|uniref:(apollo) hypothetical protein n=1 Tax=Parnassius apollo TaxID=110799 RepID=A0A8S3WX83_PARAO|nr:unnamed protein product [Parnassius apollo]